MSNNPYTFDHADSFVGRKEGHDNNYYSEGGCDLTSYHNSYVSAGRNDGIDEPYDGLYEPEEDEEEEEEIYMNELTEDAKRHVTERGEYVIP